jgi:GST-like protein
MIDLYYWPTPNGKKVTILLEECALPYRVIPVNIARGDQFDPAFLRLSPNNRMPAIVDHEPPGGGEPLSVFESGAILMYLAEKTGRFWPTEPRQRYEVAQWVFWQMANQGPKFGERGHFERAARVPKNGDLAYPLKRFDDEVNRLYGVMNNRLHDRRYLAGDDYSIADIISYPWACRPDLRGQAIAEFPNVARWIADVGSRPAVQRGMDIGKDYAEDLNKLTPEELERRSRLLSNQRARPLPVS